MHMFNINPWENQNSNSRLNLRWNLLYLCRELLQIPMEFVEFASLTKIEK